MSQIFKPIPILKYKESYAVLPTVFKPAGPAQPKPRKPQTQPRPPKKPQKPLPKVIYHGPFLLYRRSSTPKK